MSKLLAVPAGWTRGGPLIIERKKAKGRMVWLVREEISFDPEKELPFDAVAFFYRESWDEIATFVKWWHKYS